MDFAARLQALRKAQALSQEALADRLGVSRQAIGKWESGAALPSVDNLLELAAILETTVDYLLTGAELPQDPSDPLAYQAEQTVSVDALKELLAQQEPKKRSRWPYFAMGAVLLVLLSVLGYYIFQLEELDRRVSDLYTSIHMLDSQMQGSLGSIQAGIEDSLNQQASILSASDWQPGDFDMDTQTATVHLSATPKTLTEDTRLYFVLSPMTSSRDTLDQPITVEGRIPAVEGPSIGAYTAEVQVPMVQDFVVSVLLEQEGFRHTETILQEYGFSSMYVCTMTVWADSFTWSASSSAGKGTVTVSGHPAITVVPSPATSAPKPDTLLCELYIDGELVESDEIDAYEAFYGSRAHDGEDGEEASGIVDCTFYPSPQDTRSYPTDGNPDVHWKFTLTDTAGNVFEDVLDW